MGRPHPVTMEWDKHPEEIAEYLSRKGAVDLLAIIDGDGLRYTDIREMTSISSATLSKRLEEGQDYLLLKRDSQRKDGEMVNLYKTTEIGDVIRHKMRGLGMIETYNTLRILNKEYQEQCSELTDQIKAKESLVDGYTLIAISEEIEGVGNTSRNYDTEL